MIQRASCLALLICSFYFSNSQEIQNDSTQSSIIFQDNRAELFTEISTLNPKKAAFLSAALPGMGQIYNRQYWKLPFIYGGAVIIGHYVKYQDRLYRSFRSAWLAQNDADANTVNPYTNASSEILERTAEGLRRDRDYLMIIGGLFYLLQIADAHISAHLHEFQINDELSMNIGPSIQPSALISRSVGVSVSLNFK